MSPNLVKVIKFCHMSGHSKSQGNLSNTVVGYTMGPPDKVIITRVVLLMRWLLSDISLFLIHSYTIVYKLHLRT